MQKTKLTKQNYNKHKICLLYITGPRKRITVLTKKKMTNPPFLIRMKKCFFF